MPGIVPSRLTEIALPVIADSEAMMADPMAGQLAYDDIVTMTDEMLAATARWLPQFTA